MALREFEDGAGSQWRVWDTVPATTTGIREEHRAGWLTFDNGRDRRRLAPIPQEWALMSDDRLRLLLHDSYDASRSDSYDASRSEVPFVERRSRERRQGERRVGDRRRPPEAS
jgi:hypothetical protein